MSTATTTDAPERASALTAYQALRPVFLAFGFVAAGGVLATATAVVTPVLFEVVSAAVRTNDWSQLVLVLGCGAAVVLSPLMVAYDARETRVRREEAEARRRRYEETHD
jgi:hypothetical protein